MKRRPTANDREIAEIFALLKDGTYDLVVEQNIGPLMGLAKLKTEGTTEINFGDRTVTLYRRKKMLAA